jgi:hypothetical protein
MREEKPLMQSDIGFIFPLFDAGIEFDSARSLTAPANRSVWWKVIKASAG